MKTSEIEKKLNPNCNKLINKDGNYTAIIFDAELDSFECDFIPPGVVEIQTKGAEYVALTRDNLQMLIDFMDEVDIEIE